MSRPDFDRQMKRLAGLKFAPATMDTHFAVLGSLALQDLDAGIALAATEAHEFPSPAGLLEFVHRAKPRIEPDHEDRGRDIEPKAIPLPTGRVLPITRIWAYYCERCSDSGWMSLWCGEPGPTRAPWSDFAACGRDREHLPHEWVARCGCWDSNPALIRQRDRQAQAAATRTAKSGRGE